jgi:hypothetical protein
MEDRHRFVCHRMEAAQSTNQSNGRGYAFDRIVDESPLWIRALVEIFRPRSLVILAVVAGCVSLFWIG